MLKYTIAGDDGTFSPSHKQDKSDPYMKEALDSHNPKGKAKLLMKKRARQKRHEYSLFPPIAHGQTLRKDTQTSCNTHVDDNELALVNGHNISRVNDVTTPYVMHSNYSHKIETMSPVPSHVKELTRISQMSNGNVVEVQRISKDQSFTFDSKHASSPYIERTDRKSKTDRRQTSRKSLNCPHQMENEKNPKLLLNTNKIGLVERLDRNRYREIKNPKVDENFSIRKKIEQFRKWHEKEMINSKIEKLHKEVDDQYDADKKKITKPLVDMSDLPTVFSPQHSSRLGRKSNEDKVNHTVNRQEDHLMQDDSAGGPEVERSPSEQTWRTWRDVNDSYAYSDVRKYIKDNELMGSEKEEWIKKWVIEVNSAMEADSTTEGSVT